MIDSENNGLSSSAVKPKHIVTPIILKDPTVSFSELKEVVYYPGNEKDSLDDAEAKARCTTLKRVSFGSSPETNVETFVYERIADDYSVESRHCYLSPPPPSSPTKVRVELRDTQLPCSIEPPSEIGLILADGTVTPAASLANNSLLSKSNVVLSTTVVPPQIPSRKKMEDHENPFRDGSLRTEVEPIVEGFKKKPFHAPADQEQSMVVRDLMSSSTVIDFARSSEVTISKAQAVSLPFRNDNLTQLRPSVETFVDSVDGGVVIERERGSTAKKRPSATATDVESPKTSAAVANLLRNDSQKNSADVEHKVLVSPRIGQVEMVHLEEDDAKKKRCGHCCVVQ